MSPPKLQAHWEELSKAAAGPTLTRAEPGVQAPGSTGWQGWGTSVPAAWVAEFTAGLPSDLQFPKEGTFDVVMSDTTPAAAPAATLPPVALNVAGKVPDEHLRVAPVHTRSGMAVLPRGSTAV
jgi:hypothetical protein